MTDAKMQVRVLIAGATGFIGRFIAQASLAVVHHSTYILVRPTSITNPNPIVKTLQDKGAKVLHGLIDDKALMEKILKEHEIDVVISAVGGENITAQLPLAEAIRTAGTVKRFLPSEFGHDVDRSDPVEPGMTMYREKRAVRRRIEQLGIPYTYICCNSIASWPYYDNKHPSEVLPPLDYFQIYGDGSIKAYFLAGSDIGNFTMKSLKDPRTLNKCLHFRPSCNLYNMNELASLWETKIGRALPRVTVTETDLLTAAAENCIPQSIVASFTHDIFIKGCQINFSIDGPDDVEVTGLYPDEAFKPLDECFNEFVDRMNNNASSAHDVANGNADNITAADPTPTPTPTPVVEALPITCA